MKGLRNAGIVVDEERIGWTKERGKAPLFKTALHSSSLFWTGYSVMSFALELKSEPKKGIVGMDLRTVPLVKGAIAFWVAGEWAKRVVLLMV